DVLVEFLEERVQQAGVPPLVLRHRRARDPGLQLGSTQDPLAVPHPEQALAVRQHEDQVANRLLRRRRQAGRLNRRCHGQRPSAVLRSELKTSISRSRGATHMSNQRSSSYIWYA